ncbi:MAG: LytTR family transcriptional regulator DNA-binding domain-containing protein [Bacteroidaceae bacterium]|nr:LytTR family transcriptional regulator DNA-binding domain-containing protein [Bacteroidaceae bacterium]
MKGKGKYFSVSSESELVRIPAASIVCFSADGNYSLVKQLDGEVRQLFCNLSQVEKLLGQQLDEDSSTFVRCGRGDIINTLYIYYINPLRQKLILSDAATFRHELKVSKEALRELRRVLEK